MWILTLGAIVLVVGVVYGTRIEGVSGSLIPIVWWHVDDRQVSTREWVSFEDRATHEPNEPYLRLCLRKARALSPTFKVEPVIGRAAAIQRLEAAGCAVPDGAERCPPALWMAWVRCAMLAHLGGLWLDGSVLLLATGADIQRRLTHAAMSFGTDPDESLLSKDTAPGRSAGWAAAPGHPMWVGLAKDIGAVIRAGDQSWSSFEARRSLRYLMDIYKGPIDRRAEVSRSVYGKRLNYEDLFETTDLPTGTTDGGLWVPLPDGRDKMSTASAFLWFTRLSEEQILESHFNWARLARTS